jgi:hypothetical protein
VSVARRMLLKRPGFPGLESGAERPHFSCPPRGGPPKDLVHRVLKLVPGGAIFGLRREALPFGEAPKGVLKLALPGAKSGTP